MNHVKVGINTTKIETDVTRREMHQMIRTLRFDTQHMRPLPANARMVFRITHTDNAPEDMLLPGFETVDEPAKFRFFNDDPAKYPKALQPVKLRIGDVNTVFFYNFLKFSPCQVTICWPQQEYDSVKVRLTARQENLEYMHEADDEPRLLAAKAHPTPQPLPAVDADIANVLVDMQNLDAKVGASLAAKVPQVARTRKSKRSLATKKTQLKKSLSPEADNSSAAIIAATNIGGTDSVEPNEMTSISAAEPASFKHLGVPTVATMRPSAARQLQPVLESRDDFENHDTVVPSLGMETAGLMSSDWDVDREQLLRGFEIEDSQDSAAAPPRKLRRTSILRKPIPCGVPSASNSAVLKRV